MLSKPPLPHRVVVMKRGGGGHVRWLKLLRGRVRIESVKTWPSPHFFLFVLQHPHLSKRKLYSVIFCVSLNKHVHKFLNHRNPHLHFTCGSGRTGNVRLSFHPAFLLLLQAGLERDRSKRMNFKTVCIFFFKKTTLYLPLRKLTCKPKQKVVRALVEWRHMQGPAWVSETWRTINISVGCLSISGGPGRASWDKKYSNLYSLLIFWGNKLAAHVDVV